MKRTGKNLKSKFEEVQFQWRRNIAPNIGEKCNLIEEVCQQLKESASLSKIKPTKATRYALSLIN